MKKNRLLKIILIIVFVLIVFVVIGKNAGWFGGTQAEKVAVEKVEKRTIIEIITANGKVQPETEVKISPDVSGEIVELHVQEGDEVKEGDLLLKIKPDIYLSNLNKMKASLNSAKSNLANARARLAQIKAQFTQKQLEYQRQKKLYNEGAISQAEYETAYAAYQVASAEVEAAEQSVNSSSFAVRSAEASLNEAQENLTKTTIYAPMSGTVSALNVEKGERVVGTMQMAGTEMLRIANLNKMEVIVEVNENDIVRVTHGDTALIEVDAYLEDEFKGVVTEIANSANISGVSADQVTNFEVKILILRASYQHLIPDNNPKYYPFRPGMSATVDIQTETKYDVLTVPIQAVTTRADTTIKKMEEIPDKKKNDEEQEETEEDLIEVVFVYKDGMVRQKEVETGIQDNNYIELRKGADEGEEVVIAPYRTISKKLKDEMPVQKVKRKDLYKKN